MNGGKILWNSINVVDVVLFIYLKEMYVLNGFEFSTFKSYIKENGLNESLDTISGETGISVKNLNRFMGYEEFKNYKKEYEKSLNNGNSKISLN